MRELKFRAWDKTEKKMLFGADPFVIDVWGNNESIFAEPHKRENCIFEQYTGLKDKNGKEIYEGDIIQEEINFNIEITDGIFKYRVYWDEEVLCWALAPIGKESIHDELWETNLSRRVIGNIHENPELVEGAK